MLGLADPSVTLQIYVHAMPGAEQRTRHDERPVSGKPALTIAV